MKELAFLNRNAPSQPELPAAFQLRGKPMPLAGPEDTYWMADVIWTEAGYPGFLIYADARQYLFLDQKEARTAHEMFASKLPVIGEQTDRVEEGASREAAVDESRGMLWQGLTGSLLARLPLRLLRCSVNVRLALVLGFLMVSLGLYGYFFSPFSLGVLLVLPVVVASWCFRWRGAVVSMGLVPLVFVGSSLLAVGGAFWTAGWLGSALLGIGVSWLMALTIAGFHVLFERMRLLRQQLVEAGMALRQEQALNQAKDQTLLSLSHEVRLPLTQLQGYLELLDLCRDEMDVATLSTYLLQARRGCEELFELVNTALEAAVAPVAAAPGQKGFFLKQEIQSVLAQFDLHLLKEHDLHLSIPDECQVFGDQRSVRQIVRNLFMNALKYTPPSTPITISANLLQEKDGKQDGTPMVCVRVEDRGSGIPLYQQPLLFQRFVRLRNAGTEGVAGTGLGLFLCKQLVEAMGGRIWVESVGQPGMGSCFAFTLATASFPQTEERNGVGEGIKNCLGHTWEENISV